MIIDHPEKPAKITISYSTANSDEIKSIMIPVLPLNIDIICCKLIPKTDPEGFKVGKPITFEVSLEGTDENENLPYSLCFDCSKWLLSGSFNGLSKVIYNL